MRKETFPSGKLKRPERLVKEQSQKRNPTFHKESKRIVDLKGYLMRNAKCSSRQIYFKKNK